MNVLLAVVILIGLLLTWAYFRASAAERRRGDDPRWAREVYLYRGALPFPHGGVAASQAQIASYHGDPQRGSGWLWVFGPKPARGTPDVAPYSGEQWFQQNI